MVNRIFNPHQPPPDTGFWTPSADFLAQTNHHLVGLMVFPFIQYAHWPAWVPVACILAWAAVKEGILDLFVLEHDSVSGSIKDFVFYTTGALSCWAATADFAFGAALFGLVLVGLMLWDIGDQHTRMPYD